MKTKLVKSAGGARGWTEKRLYNRFKLIEILELNGVDTSGLQNDFVGLVDLSTKRFGEKITSHFLDMSQKKLFAKSAFGKLLYSLNIDVRIPFITGFWTLEAVKDNLVTNRGLRIAAEQVGGTATAPVTAIALGIGTGQDETDTALASEITTNGGQRGAATVSNQTDDTAGDTERWIKTFNFTGAFAVTEEALFDNNTSGGNMLAYQDFAAINVDNGDSLQITHNVKYARSA